MACVVVTYHPPAGTAGRLAGLARQFERLVVVDNSATPEAAEALAPLARLPGVAVVFNPSNRGIAAALNVGVAEARADGVDWIVFLDQDSDPAADFAARLMTVAAGYAGRKPLGMVGCNVTLIHERRPRYPVAAPDGGDAVDVDYLITSGSAHSVAMLDRLGGFREDFFIDAVDREYCWRAVDAGYALLRTTAPLLRHTLGSPVTARILGVEIASLNHSAFRRYFIARNGLFLIRLQARRRPIACVVIALNLIATAAKIVLVEPDKREKLARLGAGLRDGVAWRAGPDGAYAPPSARHRTRAR